MADVVLNFDTMSNEIVGTLASAIGENHMLVAHCQSKYDSIVDSIKTDNLSYCVKKFIETELDYATQGERGIGRYTEEVPRFGGYYRKALENSGEEVTNEIRKLSSRLIYKSYLYTFLALDNTSIEVTDKEKLYKAWIPKIYTFNSDVMGESVLNQLLNTVDTDVKRLRAYLKQNNFKKPWYSSDKIDGIIFGYIMAGVVLRAIEQKK